MPIVLPYSLGGVVLQSSGLDCHGPVNMTGEKTWKWPDNSSQA